VAVKIEQVEPALIETVCLRIRERLDGDAAPQCEEFVRQYYRWVPPEDLLGREALDLYGAAVAHWKFLEQRAPQEAKVRVYNPDFEQHGWQSTHTVIEIVSDDMPFVVDSVTNELTRRAFGMHLLIHPVVRVVRDDAGHLTGVLPAGAPDGEAAVAESVVHVEIDRQTDPDALDALRGHIQRVLGEVRAVVEDWPAMRAEVREIVDDLAASPPPVEPEEVEEARALLTWLDDHHFTFLGYRDYDLAAEDRLTFVPGSGLGILRQPADAPATPSVNFARLSPAARALARSPAVLNLTKANSRATVHRLSYLDHVGVKRFDASGAVIGERRFLGLYTSRAYRSRPKDIPVVRRKVQAVMERAHFPRGGHNEKALLEILDTFPRDELFQIAQDELFNQAMGILALGERQRVRLFVRADAYERFLSCLLFLPRDRFDTENRLKAMNILRDAFGAESIDFSLRLGESVLVRIHFIARVRPGEMPSYDVDDLEHRIVVATRSWADDLHDALTDEWGEERGNELFRRYGQAFPIPYRADWVARSAVADIGRMEELPLHGGLAVSLYRPLEAAPGSLRCKLLRSGEPAELADVLPVLQNMGLRVVEERPYEIAPVDGPPTWIYDFGLDHAGAGELDVDAVRDRFHEAFTRIWRGEADDDGFNALVLRTPLTWRDISVLRAVARYLRQAGTTFSNSYMEQSVVKHAPIAQAIVDLFNARFDPARRRDDKATDARARAVEAAIDDVESLDEDRILRNFLSVVKAMLRTNHFQRGKPYLSFKLDPARIPVVPAPRPRFEIFLYSPRTEGVHLRGGKVARGGLRWSDRREDFRTEILGLMKAQMVKNALIVPVGAKGGFVVKRPPAGGGRDALAGEVVDCYRMFIRGLLDITDNIVDGRVVPPPDVVRFDEDDPYLVVAADKGTATFSDIANGVAAEYGFWLGDAFASGGAQGYDHKRMGITARGAWESVKRHFRELGTDIQTTDFSVVGVGDMSGDVFGNGMLLSRHIRLVGAFDHRHVFLDPDPDPAASFAERERLFALERSSWADYDPALISDGGGVWPRTAKAIPVSAAARAVLGITAESLTPNELIRAILRAPVDLLFNGGIGTYVKARGESHADAGDKANDSVRVDGADLHARVVGEGGNLGFTQRGRIEFALAGGRVYTDAIDNAAGVNCSDHEVNIKVLLDAIVTAGDLTAKQRNELLVAMTDGVAGAVLHDSYRQTQSLALASAQAPGMLHVHDRFMRSLEGPGRLDRALEFLPGAEAIAERAAAKLGLTQPELAVLLAYSKVGLYDALVGSDLPDDPHLDQDLQRYFPPPLPERFSAQMRDHRLRREIIATRVATSLVDRAGTTFAFRLHEETGAAPADIARAYTIAREVFGMRTFWEQVEALDNVVDAGTQTAMLLEARRLVERGTRWLLRNCRRPIDIAAGIERYAPGAQTVFAALPDVLVDAERESFMAGATALQEAGVPAEQARIVASLGALFSALDVVQAADATGHSFADVAALHFLVGGRLRLHWLRDRIAELPRDNRWQAMARAALRDDLFALHGELTAHILRQGEGDGDAWERLEAWLDANSGGVERCLAILTDIEATGTFDLTTLPVALREVRTLITSR
jgi:glutamate dehydrogenase